LSNNQVARYDKQPCVSFMRPMCCPLIWLTEGKKKRLPRTATDIPWAFAMKLVSRDRCFFVRALHTEFTIITIGYQDSILSPGVPPSGCQSNYWNHWWRY